MKTNTLVVHDTEYALCKVYREGALAFRSSTPWGCNPYRYGSDSHDFWDYGHTNESAGEHIRFGVDVISAPLNGRRFEMDEAVPRDENGDVATDWHREQLKKLNSALVPA